MLHGASLQYAGYGLASPPPRQCKISDFLTQSEKKFEKPDKSIYFCVLKAGRSGSGSDFGVAAFLDVEGSQPPNWLSINKSQFFNNKFYLIFFTQSINPTVN